MNTQPEALRLAEKMKSYSLSSGYAWHCHKAADELRRLHEAEEHNRKYVESLEKEVKRLHEANQALLEALKAVMEYDGYEIPYETFMSARAAIAKGETK